MRIERHHIATSPLADFPDRIGRQVHSYSRAGLMTSTEWQLISDAFLDQLGALSTSSPDLASPEAKALLRDASEAAAGAVSFAAYHPRDRFSVFLDYVNFGMSYDPDPTEAAAPPLSAQRWVNAFCLAVLTDTFDRHAEAFVFSGQALSPASDLATALLSHLLPRVDSPSPASDDPAFHALHALRTGDRPAFDAAVLALLDRTDGTRPRTLLPLLPLALSALAHRDHGWLPSIDTDYLPHSLVTRFATPERRPESMTWPVRVDRPTPPLPLHPDVEARFEQAVRRGIDPSPDETHPVFELGRALEKQVRLFRTRASRAADVTEEQVADLRLASEMGAALFRIALADPGTTVAVPLAGRTVHFPATCDEESWPGRWHLALNLALITGSRDDLAPLLLAGPTRSARDRSAYADYRVALHDHLRGLDARPAVEKARLEVARAQEWNFFPDSVGLLAQLVDGDETGFNLALLDTLEAHRDHYSVADRATDPDAPLDLDVLALVCHARRHHGWTVRVESPYLPARLLADHDSAHGL
ncbi:immunity 49 family protein [Kitasatospora sp. NPDC036755]|uniref:immunity 49 family protein n=1 Tax=Kitasatospora sp. NPDC036755 TaxID=3154600 RepID=UPI0033E0A288